MKKNRKCVQTVLFNIRALFEISVFEISLFEISVFEISVFEISVFEISVSEISVFEISVFEISVFEISVFEIMRVNYSSCPPHQFHPSLTPSYWETRKKVIGKQCRPRSDAT